MVAPSFQQLNQISEPYEVSGKMYVKLENPKTKNIRQVRWYTEDEYAKAFKSAAPETSSLDNWNYKKALGFEKGNITIFKNGYDMDDAWFNESAARYSAVWGWYFTSEVELPGDLPSNAQPVSLPWELISSDRIKPNPTEVVRAAVQKLLYGDSCSTHQGSVGERLERNLKLQDYNTFTTQYGKTYKYEFVDANDNVYLWVTSARVLEKGVHYRIRGTVKEHQINKGVETTVLTRCMIAN